LRGDYADFLPEDVLREVEEAERGLKPRGRRRHRPYPRGSDLAAVVVEAVATFYGHPDEFPDYVLELLESRGFDTRFVTVKRIWRTYETLVRKGVMGDRLGVME